MLEELHSLSRRWWRHREKFLRTLEAAKQRDANAQYKVGLMYFRGKGVPENRKKAILWMRRAYSQGHRGAAKKLGLPK